jgi:hypothetical protein
VIVLDEDLQEPEVAASLRTWYPGPVVSVKSLRPAAQIDDPDIPTLLR